MRPQAKNALDPPSSYRPDVYAGTLCTAVRWFSQVPQVWNISFQCDFLSFLAILTEGQRVRVILIVLGIVEELILSFQRFEKAALFPLVLQVEENCASGFYCL